MKKKITLNQSENILLSQAFENFITEKRLINLSKETIKYYENCYKYFTDFLEEDISCDEIDKMTVLSYMDYLQSKDEKLSEASVNNYLRGIRAVLYYCMSEGYTSNFKISMISEVETIKEVYTDRELEKVLKKPNLKKCSFSEYRNWVITNYLLATGNRLNTIINLKIKDIDVENKEIYLRTLKRKKQYIIPMSATLQKVLKEYLKYRKGDSEDYLFCTNYSNQFTNEGLKTAIQRYNIKRGVSKTSIHLFRNTFAKMWILNRGDLITLKNILGHKTMAMVERYAKIYGADLKKNFDYFNPLDNLDFVDNGNKINMDRK